MKISYNHIALGASALVPRVMNDTRPVASILMTTTEKIMVANYDGSTFSTNLVSLVSGAPTWAHFVEPNLLYAVNENGADMRLFHLDFGCNGSVSLSEPVATVNGSVGVVHLELSKDNTRMVGSAYGSAAVDIWDVSDGQLKLIKTLNSTGELGPAKGQDAPRPHQAVLDPSGRYFAVNDLGTDSILFIDSKDDLFEITHTVKVEHPGCAPRHGVFYPADAAQATHYMILCEKANAVIVYELSYLDTYIALTERQFISTFAANTAPEGAAAGEIVLSPNNKDLYVSNRLTGKDTDSIAHFKLAADGSLTFISQASSGGTLPRMFSLYTGGTEILLGNQNGPLAVAAFTLEDNGSVAQIPRASMELSVFGEKGFGPPFIKQIR